MFGEQHEWITTQYEFSLSRWQKFLNIFRRWFNFPIVGSTIVIKRRAWQPFGLLTDGESSNVKSEIE